MLFLTIKKWCIPSVAEGASSNFIISIDIFTAICYAVDSTSAESEVSYMTKKELRMKNVSVCVLYFKALTSSFTSAAIREKSAHFCRYSCASSVIL